jgi:hypothetical protein
LPGDRLRRCDRKLDDEDAAFAGHVANPDLATVRLHGGAADLEPSPSPVLSFARRSDEGNGSFSSPSGKPPHSSSTAM